MPKQAWLSPAGPLRITGQVKGFGHHSGGQVKTVKGPKQMSLSGRTGWGLFPASPWLLAGRRQGPRLAAEGRVCPVPRGCRLHHSARSGREDSLGYPPGASQTCASCCPQPPSPPDCPPLWAQSHSDPEALQSPLPYSCPQKVLEGSVSRLSHHNPQNKVAFTGGANGTHGHVSTHISLTLKLQEAMLGHWVPHDPKPIPSHPIQVFKVLVAFCGLVG